KEGLNLKCEMLKINGSSELKQDGFLVHHFMKVPDFAKRLDELIDLQKFPYGGVDLFIRVPAELVAVADTVVSNSNKKEKGHKKSFLIIPIIVGIGAFILVICSFLWWKKSSTRDRGRQPRNSIIGEEKQMKLDELPLYDFEKLEIATNYFHFGNMLGKGGFGPVYKGVMEDGQEIAVKRLSKASGQGIEEFMNEVVVISKLQHRNLVRILGCCVERGEQMLVYEFMPNKSLDAFLFG
ncbi:G-type lectin S-receptor-like serine/threonine-kinase, partial [Trifolium pratense]